MKIFLLALSIPVLAHAHGGGLDANGCHTNRKTGDYHCHGGKAASAAPSAPPPRQANGFMPTSPGQPTCHVGPRGGTYTITKSGRKNYGGC
jgi:hypothetical protein